MNGLTHLGNFLGIHFVPENHVAAVIRMGMYHRLVGPGLAWRIPLIENVTAPIHTGVQFLSMTIKRALSKDAIPIDIGLTLLYSFDPSRLPRPLATQLVRYSPDQLKQIAEDKTHYCLRRMVARFEARQLCEGATVIRMQHDLTRALAAELRSLGMVPMRNEGVIIKEVSLPNDLLRTILEVKRHELTLEAFNKHGDSKISKAVVAELANNTDDHSGVFPLFMLANQMQLLNGDGKDDRPHDDQPQGQSG